MVHCLLALNASWMDSWMMMMILVRLPQTDEDVSQIWANTCPRKQGRFSQK